MTLSAIWGRTTSSLWICPRRVAVHIGELIIFADFRQGSSAKQDSHRCRNLHFLPQKITIFDRFQHRFVNKNPQILHAVGQIPPIFARLRRGRCPEQGLRSPASHSASPSPAQRSHGTAACAACAACACAADTGGARWDPNGPRFQLTLW